MRYRTAPVAVLLSVAATSASVVPAHAQAPAEHCVVSVQDGAATCYRSFRTAIGKATGGRVTDAPDSPALAVAEPTFEADLNRSAGTTTVQAPTVIGIEYSDNDFRGSSLIYTASRACDPDVDHDHPDFWVNTLPSGWNDEIESFRTYADCAALHFWGIYRGGPALGYWYSWGDLYWMDDEVSSIAWT